MVSLIQAFGALAREYPDLDLVLVGPKMAGQPSWGNLFRQLGIEGRVIFTGKVADADISRLLYIGAEAFVMPSLYEGFGLPPVEAMACGTPVVCSRATSLPEVTGAAALLVDASRPREITDALRRLLTDKAIKNKCVMEGFLQAKQFNEDVIMPRMREFIRQAAS